MRVTHVITGLDRGGAENTLYRLVAAQPNPSQHSVISLTDAGLFGERLRALGVEVRCLDLRRGSIPSPMAILRLRRWLNQLRPAVVQTWMYHADLIGGIAARLAGVPVCWGIHHSNLTPGQNKRMTLMVAALCARLSALVPARIVSCSARAIEAHSRIGYADKFDLIPNGLDLSHFKPLAAEGQQAVRAALGIPVHDRVVGHISRADPIKDHASLLAAFSLVAARRPDTWLLMAGLGLKSGDPYFEALVSDSNVAPFSNRIVALGQRDDVAQILSSMDVFVLSSIGEAFPNVLVEAMACGTPCVATDAGDSAEIVGGTGWVRPPRDIAGLVRSVIAALEEPERERSARRRLARQRIADNFTIQRMVDAYEATWRQALRGR